MFKVALINMPFASLHLPSIALTQLSAVLEGSFGGRVSTSIHYLNHDVGRYFGGKTYSAISDSVASTASGLGDWLFRRIAFPQLGDNMKEYLQRYPAAFGNGAARSELELLRGLDAFVDELIDRYALDRCDVAGFTSMFAQNAASIAMARRLKMRNPSIVTVMGGANCETSMGGVLSRNVDAIDFVFSGPSLRTFPRLVGHLMAGEEEQCHDIRGVFSRKRFQAGTVAKGCNEIGEELPLDCDVALDYDGFMQSLADKCPGIKPVLLFETSRGCWWGEKAHCTFCGLNGTTMKYRSMQADRAVSEINGLFKYYPRVQRYEACDNILPREYLTDVLPRLETPPGASLFYEVKADLKADEMKVLADAGVTAIQPGIEALATSTLKLMRKGTSSFQNLTFLKHCLSYNIHPSWNLLIGFPGEPAEVYRKYTEDLPRLMHLPPPSGAYPVRFDRFSPYFTLAEKYNLKLEPMDFYSLIYPFPDHELKEMAYFLADQNYENAYLATTAQWVKKLEAACQLWNTRWHQRDGKLKPSLEFAWRDGQQLVVDTRAGGSIEHELRPTALRLLDGLGEPRRIADLRTELSDVSPEELECELSDLRRRGLVFEEGDRFMSLVIAPRAGAECELAEW